MVTEFLSPLWVSDPLYHVSKSPPMAPIPNQVNPFRTPYPISLKFISILSCHLQRGLPSSLFPLSFLAGMLHVFLTKLDIKIIHSDSHSRSEDRVRNPGRSLASSRLPVLPSARPSVCLSLFVRIYTRGFH